MLLNNPACVGARDTGVACTAGALLGGALTSCSRRVASARSGPDASLMLLRRRPGVCTCIKPVSQSASGRRARQLPAVFHGMRAADYILNGKAAGTRQLMQHVTR